MNQTFKLTFFLLIFLHLVFTSNIVIATDYPKLPAIDVNSLIPKVYVENFELEGSKLIDSEIFNKITSSYTKKYLSFGDISEVAKALTRHLVQSGYINSVVLVPDQDISNNIVKLELIEGRLDSINVLGTNRIKTNYLISRLNKNQNTTFAYQIVKQICYPRR